uniref:Uncharacterized protein n=1 Tax=Meloidogyne javanica TaxID=6303 RepID=A0A915MBL3_MELJA
MANNPETPQRGEHLASFLNRVMGPVDWDSSHLRHRAEGLISLVWKDLTLRGQAMPANRPILSRPAFIEKGQPLAFPRMPCLIFERGIRGTSRKSRQNSRRVGHACWRSGHDHRDYIPLEKVFYKPEEQINPAKPPTPPPSSEQALENPKEIKIVASGVKTLTITFLLALSFSLSSADNHFNSMPSPVVSLISPVGPGLIISRTVLIVNNSDYFLCNYIRAKSVMSKRQANGDSTEAKRKVREQSYIEEFGPIQTTDDLQALEDWLDTDDTTPLPTATTVIDMNNKESEEWKLVGNNPAGTSTTPQFYSVLTLPAEQSLKNIGDKQQQQSLMAAPPQQQIGETASSRLESRLAKEKKARHEAEAKAKAVQEDRAEQKLLLQTVLALLQSKGNEKKEIESTPNLGPNITASAPTIAVAPPDFSVPPPAPLPLKSVAVPSGRHKQEKLGLNQSSHSIIRNRPFVPRSDGQGSSRQSAGSRIPNSARAVETHLHAVRELARQLVEAVGNARAEINMDRLGEFNAEFVQEVLAVEAAARIMKRTIKTAFLHLNIQP